MTLKIFPTPFAPTQVTISITSEKDVMTILEMRDINPARDIFNTVNILTDMNGNRTSMNTFIRKVSECIYN